MNVLRMKLHADEGEQCVHEHGAEGVVGGCAWGGPNLSYSLAGIIWAMVASGPPLGKSCTTLSFPARRMNSLNPKESRSGFGGGRVDPDCSWATARFRSFTEVTRL